MNFKNPYFTNVERIQLLERWIILHSYLYYELNENIVSDANYNANTKQLLYLKEKYPESFKKTKYYKYFKDFESGTGFDLYSKIKSDNNIELMKALENDYKLLKNNLKKS